MRVRDITSQDEHELPSATPVLSDFDYPVTEKQALSFPRPGADDMPCTLAGCEPGARVYVMSDDEDDERPGHVLWWASEVIGDFVHCECGEWSGERCEWEGPRNSTVVVEWMPVHLRASHMAAGGNSGIYPQNGAQRLRVHHECADRILKDDSEWSDLVEGEGP